MSKKIQVKNVDDMQELRKKCASLVRERNMWREDFYMLQSMVQSMTLFKRIRYVFTNKLD